MIDAGILSFQAVGANLQVREVWDGGEPHPNVIARARTRRRKKEARPSFFMAYPLTNKNTDVPCELSQASGKSRIDVDQ